MTVLDKSVLQIKTIKSKTSGLSIRFDAKEDSAYKTERRGELKDHRVRESLSERAIEVDSKRPKQYNSLTARILQLNS